MIIRFSVENYKSFKEQQIFTMVAGKGGQHPSHIMKICDKSVLKSSFFFGANASGKSNLIHAIGYMCRTVCQGTVKKAKPQDSYFRIDEECRDKPGIFQMELTTNQKFYSYGFSVNYTKRTVEAEWLYRIDDNKEDYCLFERDTENPPIRTELLENSENEDDKSRFRIYGADIGDHQLFLQQIADKKLSDNSIFREIQQVFQWFNKIIVVYPNSQVSDRNSYYLSDNQNDLARLLSDFDTGILNLSGGMHPLEETLRFLPKEIFDSLIDGLQTDKLDSETHVMNINGRQFHVCRQDGQLKAEELLMDHGNSNDLFRLSDESDGTQRLFDLIPLYQYAKNGCIVLIDEIDRSLHSELTKEFIKKYFSLTIGCESQLICTTHDTGVMDLNLLRRDEIWFVERGIDHSSSIYSLSKYKTKSSENVLSNYLIGRYGAIPCLKEDVQ